MTDSLSEKVRGGREKVSIPCTFGMSDDTPRKGTVTSLSDRRCFVKTRAWAKDGMEMHLKLWLPEQRWLHLRATVLYCLEKIGFELLFNGTTSEEVEALRNLIQSAQSSNTSGDEQVERSEDEAETVEEESGG